MTAVEKEKHVGPKSNMLGMFEYIVLQVVLVLKEDAYSLSVRQKLEEVFTRPFSQGATFTTLNRLTKQGLLKTRWNYEGSVKHGRGPGGRSVKCYRLTKSGWQVLCNYNRELIKLRKSSQLAFEDERRKRKAQ